MTEGNKLECEGCGTTMPTSDMLLMNGQFVHVLGLEEIMESVRRMKLSQRKKVADELLSRVKASNAIPEGTEADYRSSLMDEYDRRYLSIM